MKFYCQIFSYFKMLRGPEMAGGPSL